MALLLQEMVTDGPLELRKACSDAMQKPAFGSPLCCQACPLGLASLGLTEGRGCRLPRGLLGGSGPPTIVATFRGQVCGVIFSD